MKDTQKIIECNEKEKKEGTNSAEMVQEAKYLGNWTSIKDRSRININNRIKALGEGYYANQNFWCNKEVPLKAKVTVSRSNVISAGITGLEAEVLNKEDCRIIDKELMRLARKVMCGKAKTEREGTITALRNEKVREAMDFYTTDSMVRKKRLKWIQNIIMNPEDNVMLRAVLTGG